MPCTLQPWEVEYEEQQANQEKFGRELTDSALLEEVACAACRALVKQGHLKDAPEIVQKWWRLHKAKDKKAGRKLPRRKRAK
jgi:hypothetical protein